MIDKITRRKRNSGFTLLEILVVISIMILMSGFVMARFNDENSGKSLDADARKLVDILELAKKRSISGESKIGGNPACKTFLGYQVVVHPSSYEMSFCCNDGSTTTCNNNYQRYGLNANNSIISPVDGTTYTFDIIDGKVTVTGGGGRVVTIKNTVINKCTNVTTRIYGVIEILNNENRYSC